jgi:hypothetical protein
LETIKDEAKLWAWVGAVGLGMAFLPVWCMFCNHHVLGVPTHMQGRKWSPSGTRGLERKWCALCMLWMVAIGLLVLLLPGTSISLSDLQEMQILWRYCSHMSYCYGQVNPARSKFKKNPARLLIWSASAVPWMYAFLVLWGSLPLVINQFI